MDWQEEKKYLQRIAPMSTHTINSVLKYIVLPRLTYFKKSENIQDNIPFVAPVRNSALDTGTQE